VKHAFLILAHKNPTQLMWMISALQAENSWFFVHVDQKSNLLNFLQSMIEFPKNVQICKKQFNINWGGFSMIEATVSLMRMVCDSDLHPDYVHLLSGQDFPLCSISKIDCFFENNSGKNFINYFTIPYDGWAYNGGLDRINYKWDIDNGEKEKSQLDTCSFPEGIQPYGGWQWWSLTGECVEWLTEICRPGELLYDFYRHTLIPDEMFFQTVIMHYSHIIQTIHHLTERIDNTYVNIRINYDEKTLHHINELLNDLLELDRKKVGIHFERVWQTENKTDNSLPSDGC